MEEDHKQHQGPKLSWSRRIAGVALLFVLCLVLIGAGLACFVRIGFDGNRVARLLLPRLGAALDMSISYSSAQLTWISAGTGMITLGDLKIADPKDRAVLLHVPTTQIEVSFSRILSRTILLSHVRLIHPTLIVDSKPRDAELAPESPSRGMRSLYFFPVITGLDLVDGQVLVREAREKAKAGSAILSGIHLRASEISLFGIKGLDARGYARGGQQAGTFEISGALESTSLEGREWQGKVSVRLSSFPVGSLHALVGHFGYDFPLTAGTTDFTGQVGGKTGNWKASADLNLHRAVVSPNGMFLKPVLIEAAATRFSAELVNDVIQLGFSEVGLPGMQIAGEVTAGDIWAADPSLTIALRKADLNLERLSPFIPVSFMRKEDRDRLVDAGLKGHVLVTGGAWSGRLSDLTQGLNLQGTMVLDASLNRVSGFIPGFGIQLTNATGQIRLNAEEMQLNGISLTLGNSPIVLNGRFTDLRTSPRVDLFVSMDADAQDLEPVLTNRLVAARLEQWTERLLEPSGGVSVTLDLKGPLDSPALKGQISFNDFQCRIAGLALPLKKINGSVRFRSSVASVSEIKGNLGNSPASLKGKVTAQGMELIGDLQLAPADLRKLGVLPEGLVISRSVPLSVEVKGKPAQLRFSGLVDLNETALGLGHIIKKRAGVPLQIEASGVRDDRGISVEDAYVVLGPIRIAARATIKDGGELNAVLNLPANGVQTDAMIAFTDPVLELQRGGRLEGDAVIRTEKSGESVLDTNLQMNYLSLRFPGFHKRTEGITGLLRLRGHTLQLTVERARTGSSIMSGSLVMTGFERPKLEVTLDYSFLDTTDFTAPPGSVSTMTWGEWIRSNALIRLLAGSKGTGFVKVAKGKTATRTFSDFRANVESGEGLMKVPSWQLNFADGIIHGTALFDIRANTKKPLTLQLQADKLRMERVMMSDPEWLRVEGEMTAAGELEWKTSTSRENYGVHKTGNIEVHVRHGVVNRFDILSKLFSLVNLGAITKGRLPDLIGEGLPFQSLSWNMDVFDSKWKVKDMKLIADAARVDSSGMYFADQDKIDFRVDISPLVGLDNIVSGLLGNLLPREGKLLTTTFRIRGLYTSPDVRLEPFQQFKSHQ